MDAGRMLRTARRDAGLSQRELADLVGVPQPAVARIESGRVHPRLDTFDRLLEGCGRALALIPRPGSGVDRTTIRELLDLTPSERLRRATREGRNLDRLVQTARR